MTEQPPPQAPAAQQPGRGPATDWTWPAAAIFISLLILVPAAVLFWLSPSAKARRLFAAGVVLQTRGRYDEALELFAQAFQLDGRLAPAALRAGLCVLHIGSPIPDVEAWKRILQDAAWSQAAALDQADYWFARAAEAASKLRPGRRFPDSAQPSARHVLANAYACRALTAMLRAAAAIRAHRFSDATSWAEQAATFVQQARKHDPANAIAAAVASILPALSYGRMLEELM